MITKVSSSVLATQPWLSKMLFFIQIMFLPMQLNRPPKFFDSKLLSWPPQKCV